MVLHSARSKVHTVQLRVRGKLPMTHIPMSTLELAAALYTGRAYSITC